MTGVMAAVTVALAPAGHATPPAVEHFLPTHPAHGRPTEPAPRPGDVVPLIRYQGFALAPLGWASPVPAPPPSRARRLLDRARAGSPAPADVH